MVSSAIPVSMTGEMSATGGKGQTLFVALIIKRSDSRETLIGQFMILLSNGGYLNFDSPYGN